MLWCWCTVDQLHLQVGRSCCGVGVLWINYTYRLDAHVVVLVYCGSTTPTGWMPMWCCWCTVDQLHLQVGRPCGGVVLWINYTYRLNAHVVVLVYCGSTTPTGWTPMWWCCTVDQLHLQVECPCGGVGVLWISYTYRLDAHVVVLVYCGSTTPTGWTPMWWCCTVDQLHLQVECPCGGVGVLWISYTYRLNAHVVVLVYCGSTTPTGWMPMWWCCTVDQLCCGSTTPTCWCGGVGVLWINYTYRLNAHVVVLVYCGSVHLQVGCGGVVLWITTPTGWTLWINYTYRWTPMWWCCTVDQLHLQVDAHVVVLYCGSTTPTGWMPMWWCWCTVDQLHLQVGRPCGGVVLWINYTYRLNAHVVVLVYCGSTTPTGWTPMWWCCTVDQLHLQVECPCGGAGVLWINYTYRLDAHVVVLYCGSTTPTG